MTDQPTLIVENIPYLLKELPQWVCWRIEVIKGRTTKVPYRPGSQQHASSTQPDTWSDFSTAVDAYERGGYSGIGFVFADNGIVGVDFDHCLTDGNLHPDADHIVSTLDSYTEISPSGDGVHVILRGKKTTASCARPNMSWGGECALYEKARFFVMTGQVLDGRPADIRDRQQQLEQVISELWPSRADQTDIVRALSRQGMTVRDIAQRLGISKSTVSRLLISSGTGSDLGQNAVGQEVGQSVPCANSSGTSVVPAKIQVGQAVEQSVPAPNSVGQAVVPAKNSGGTSLVPAKNPVGQAVVQFVPSTNSGGTSVVPPVSQPNSRNAQPVSRTESFDDDDIITLIRKSRAVSKFEKYWSGLWNDPVVRCMSQSEADYKFCCMLAFYTEDENQIDRIFRQSGLMRDKWSELRGDETYGLRTIRKALSNTTERYKGRPPRKKRLLPAPGELDALIAELIEANDSTAVYKRVNDIVRFSRADQAVIKAKMREAYNGALNMNDLSASIKQARRDRASSYSSDAPTDIPNTGLPAIITTGRQLREIVTDCVVALDKANNPPDLFNRCGSVARIRADHNTGRHIIQQFTKSDRAPMCDHICQVADFYGFDKEGNRYVDKPAMSWAEMILCRRDLPFPILDSIIETPTLRPDGTIITKPGYDESTRLFYIPDPKLVLPEIPENPTSDDLNAAILTVDEAIGDFPFVDPASSANTFALLLSIVMRPVILGHLPIGLCDAPKQGTGKGLLANVIYLITTGRTGTIMTAPSGDDDDEWRKRITSVLLRGPAVIQIDNLVEPLSSPSLAAVLTCDEWEDRKLGSSETIRMPARAVWLATGNNIQVAGDMTRRCYWVRMNANVSRPWKRQDFKHRDLMGWVTSHRGELITALLTIARGWFAAGQPAWSGQPLGSFESWCRVIGGTLEQVGLDSFLSNSEAFYEQADDDSAQWTAFFDAWYRTFGPEAVTVKQIVDLLMPARGLYDWDRGEALRLALPESLMTALDKGEGNLSRRLGPSIRDKRDAIYGQYRLEHIGINSHTKLAIWRMIKLTADDAIDISLPHACRETPLKNEE